MIPVDQLRAWTHRRQRLGDPAPSALEALRSVVAVYSFHPTAPLALWARTDALRANEFRALDQDRAALRVPGMRGSLFLAPRATASLVFAPFGRSRAQMARWLTRAGVTEQAYADLADRVVATARVPMSPRELAKAVPAANVPLSLLLRVIRGDGRMLAVAGPSLRSGQLRYVATDAWAPGSLDVPAAGTGEALTRLAGEYLRAYGPARVVDFSWWTGVSRTVASAALGEHATVDLGEGLLLHAADVEAFEAISLPRDTVDLLPKWDAYTMGFAPDGRARLVHPDNQPGLYVRKGVVAPGQPPVGLPGDGYPAVLVDGEAVGTWNLTLRTASVDLFDTAGPRVRGRIDQRLRAARALLQE